MEKDENMLFGWRKTEHVQRPWGRRMLGVCEELLVNQRSGAKGMTHKRKERRGEKEEERTGVGKKRVGKEGGKKRGRSQGALGPPQKLGLFLLVRWF